MSQSDAERLNVGFAGLGSTLLVPPLDIAGLAEALAGAAVRSRRDQAPAGARHHDGATCPGRIVLRADKRVADAACGAGDLGRSGELLRGLRLVELVDAELAAVARVATVKQRQRGLSAGALVVALAESQLVGGDCFDDIEQLRADAAGPPVR